MFGFFTPREPGHRASWNEDVRFYLQRIVSHEQASRHYNTSNPFCPRDPDEEPTTKKQKKEEGDRFRQYLNNHREQWLRQVAAQHFFREKHESMSADERKDFDWEAWADDFTYNGKQKPFPPIHPDLFKPDIWKKQPSIFEAGRSITVSESDD
jgi:hypothetical protein